MTAKAAWLSRSPECDSVVLSPRWVGGGGCPGFMVQARGFSVVFWSWMPSPASSVPGMDCANCRVADQSLVLGKSLKIVCTCERYPQGLRAEGCRRLAGGLSWWSGGGGRPKGGVGGTEPWSVHVRVRGWLSFNLCYHSGALANVNSYLNFFVSR